MQKADFENRVQQKMQELRFKPSEEVWMHVEAGIASKRRRVPVLIWNTDINFSSFFKDCIRMMNMMALA